MRLKTSPGFDGGCPLTGWLHATRTLTSTLFDPANFDLFWGNCPSPEHLLGKTAEELAKELRPVSYNNCSVKRAEKILNLVRTDGDAMREHQESRDAITRSLVSDLEHYRIQLEEVNKAIENLLPKFNCP